MAATRSGDLTIAYDDLGAGDRALLCLHGWAAHRGMFAPLYPHLAGRVLAPDFRGHGASDADPSDFGEEELVQDALAVIEASGVREVVPLAVAHAGWVALELVRRLGPRVPAIVLLDWIVLDAPPPFLDALDAMTGDDAAVRAARDGLFEMWTHGVANEGVRRWVFGEMAASPLAMWRRAGRAIGAAYRTRHSPLAAMAVLQPPVPVLHLYGQPDDLGYLAAQREFATEHPWFSVVRLEGARSHFPQFEVPEQIGRLVNEFALVPSL